MTLPNRNGLLIGFCVLLVCIILVTNFIELGTVPRGLNIDEAGLAYDAWSISQTGYDSYLHRLPVYLSNRGDGMSPLYAYLAIPLIRIFGPSTSVIRIPAALFSLLTLLAGAALVRMQWPKRRLPLLLYLFLFATVPYFTMYARVALDCILFLPLSTALVALIIHALRSENPCWWAIGVLAGITLYSYATSWIILPLFLLVLCCYLASIKRLSWTDALQLWIPFIIVAIPLLGFLSINLFGRETLAVGPFTIPRLLNFRTHDFSFAPFHVVGFFSSLLLRDATFLYASRWVAPFYHLSIPFFIIGVFRAYQKAMHAVKHRNVSVLFIVILWATIYTLFSLFLNTSGMGPQMHQLNGLFFVSLFFIVLGCVAVFDWLKERDFFRIGRIGLHEIALGLFVIAYLVSFGFFVHDYFFAFPASWDQGITEKHVTGVLASLTSDLDSLGDAIAYLQSQPPEVRNRITYLRHVQIPEIYFLLSQEIPASEIYLQRRIDGRVWKYRNFRFDKPQAYSLDENYIVAHWQGEELDELHSKGFADVQRFGKYWVFSNPSTAGR